MVTEYQTPASVSTRVQRPIFWYCNMTGVPLMLVVFLLGLFAALIAPSLIALRVPESVVPCDGCEVVAE